MLGIARVEDGHGFSRAHVTLVLRIALSAHRPDEPLPARAEGLQAAASTLERPARVLPGFARIVCVPSRLSDAMDHCVDNLREARRRRLGVMAPPNLAEPLERGGDGGVFGIRGLGCRL